MNRAERRRLDRIGVTINELEPVIISEAKSRFAIALEMTEEIMYKTLRSNRVSEERARKILLEVAQEIGENGASIIQEIKEKRNDKTEN